MSVPTSCRNQEGVALVTVLMIVAAMSAVAIMLSSAVLASTNRAKALDASAQADWFAKGAGAFAQVTVDQLVSESGAKLFAGMPMLAQPMAFEIEGGVLSLTGREASNCFNINSLRQSPSPGREDTGEEPAARKDFIALLEAADIDGVDADVATATLVDWMDADLSPELGGAEDSYYSSLTPPYRTSGQPIENLSELYAIRYFDPSLVEQLRPIVCAYPDEDQQAFNINTLGEAQAPLLSLAMSGALTSEAARDVIFQRPQGGWESVEDMMATPALAQISPELRRTDMLSVTSSHIGVRTIIEYRGLRRIYDQLLVVDETGAVKPVRRERKG
ncbi:MAG: type II secretion system minor pseudopilin GspK [Henriciella sp.]|uniref:type II secretion system minor pseudopilin GspK n=1 Tax=Henriciella sp. TaxID=1968823 RepID=UPI0026041026|nr:type II secretion system minor pseudopilin GspK [Henriciella sp.]